MLVPRTVEHVATRASQETRGRFRKGREIHPLAAGSGLVGLEIALSGDEIRPGRQCAAGNGIGIGSVLVEPMFKGRRSGGCRGR